jgi:hypothetical protein
MTKARKVKMAQVAPSAPLAQETNRLKLKQFAAELRDLSPSDPPISPELSAYVATSLEAFCSGKASSLDKAFGLNPRRGAPLRPSQKKLKLTYFMIRIAADGSSGSKSKSWRLIADELVARGLADGLVGKAGPNEGDLRKIHRRYAHEIGVMIVKRKLPKDWEEQYNSSS